MARRVELSTLQQLADDAAAGVLQDLGICVQCEYLGQPSGPETSRSYTKDPRNWAIEKGSKPKNQTVAFEWRLDGRTYVVEQRCDNARQRGVRRPTELSSQRDAWCETALQKLNEAAAAFAEMHGPHILDEFGLRLQCYYKHQAETMECNPAAWKVDTRRSQCKVVFEIILPGLAPCLTPLSTLATL